MNASFECCIMYCSTGAQPFSDFILKILMIQGQNSDILVCVFIQNHVKAGMMRAQSCHWSIDRYARGCAYSVCVVFSSSFKFGASGILCVRVSGTGRKLQRHSHHASRCGRCGKRETRWPKTAATIVGLQVRPLQQRVWVAGRHGRSSQTQLVGWDTVCRSHKLQVHVNYRTRWSIIRWASSPTWYPRCESVWCTFRQFFCRPFSLGTLRILQ